MLAQPGGEVRAGAGGAETFVEVDRGQQHEGSLADFPHQHWKKIQSTNPLERLNREIKRRSDVVQAFPNTAAVNRLATAVLVELHDEWIAFPCRYLSIESMDSLYPDDTACLPGTAE